MPLALLLSTSCQHVYYVPPAQHVSLFQNEGEWRGTAALGAADESNTFDVQGSYALTGRFAVMSGLQLAWGGQRNDSSDWGQGYLLDAAFGYYKPLNEFMVFEVYGGLRHGFQQHYYAQGSWNARDADMQLQSFGQFVQPSLGLTFRHMDLAMTSGLQHLAFYDFRSSARFPEPTLFGWAFAADKRVVLGAWTDRPGWLAAVAVANAICSDGAAY